MKEAAATGGSGFMQFGLIRDGDSANEHFGIQRSLCPGQLYVRELQFVDVLQVVYEAILLQCLQKGVHIDRT